MKVLSFLSFFLFSYGLFAQSGCYTTGGLPINIDNGERYSWSLNLYKPSHIGSVGVQNTLRLRVTSAGSGSSAILTGIKIYMRHTNTASYTSPMGFPGTAGFTQVYNGSITVSSIGWVDLTLNGNFASNGTDNVEILFINDQNKSYSNVTFARTPLAAGGPNIAAERGASSWATASGSTGATRRSYALAINDMTCTESWTAGGVLPVKLAAFRTELIESAVRLSWETTSEENADFFEVQRSRDARNFEPIGKVGAKGQIDATSDYFFEDKLSGVTQFQVYYRLMTVDKDGSFEYTPIRVVHLAGNPKKEGIIYPNPVKSQRVILDLGVETGEEPGVTVRDNFGRTVPVVIQSSGKGKWTLNTNDFVPGIYFVEVLADGKSFNRKLVII